MKAFFIHSILIAAWTLLRDELSLAGFFSGYAIGLIILLLFPNIVDVRTYIKQTFGFFYFIAKFAKEFILANLSVAKIVLFERKSKLKPFFLKYNIAKLKQQEIILLSHCITLTPGTISVRISEDQKHLMIHVLNAESPHKVESSIKQKLEDPILAFTRGFP